MPSVEGVGARRAALQLLDAVLRRGQTLEGASGAVRNLSPSDHALAVAITGEALRRLPDLDALIDSATPQRLPDDSKARMVLRLALAQKLGLGTPDHALVATALPLVDGGPRRLVHGVLGTLLRRGLAPNEAPHLPAPVEQRWAADTVEPEIPARSQSHPEIPFDDLLTRCPALKPIHRVCLILRFVQGMNREEIAGQTGLTELQVKGHLQYGLKLLREALASPRSNLSVQELSADV